MAENEVAVLSEYRSNAIRECREALAACPEGYSDRAQLAHNLAYHLYDGYEETRNVALIIEAIELQREALALRSPGHPERAFSCSELDVSLYTLYHECGDLGMLEEAIQLGREALALRPPGHSERAISCENLGASLHAHYQECGELGMLEEAIKLEREVLALRPPGHPERCSMCSRFQNLAHELMHRLWHVYQETGDVALVKFSIGVQREALALYSPGHPKRTVECNNLGASLYRLYTNCNDLSILDEAIELAREALDLCPQVHVDRALKCDNLGVVLEERYKQCGDLTLLDEAIKLQREALALRPPGHPKRASTCSSLGTLLHECYMQCGDPALLDEAINFEREVLTLISLEHTDRAVGCQNLGDSLYTRYDECGGHLDVLEEAIKCEREALDLRPPGHPKRGDSCSRLGDSLHALYEKGNDLTVLDEAIKLKREALALCPQGHPDRGPGCKRLECSLDLRHRQSRDPALLDEMIELAREGLALLPPAHQDRVDAYRHLSSLLINSHRDTKDNAPLDEAIEICSNVLVDGLPSEVSHAFLILTEIHLIPDIPHFSISRSLRYLELSFESEAHDIRMHVHTIDHMLSNLWDLSTMWNSDTAWILCDVYIKLIDRLSLASDLPLNSGAQLRNLAWTQHIGTDACVVNVLAKQFPKAIELLDRAHGFVWTQALHRRDPQMEGAPPELAVELAILLRAVAAPVASQPNQTLRSATHHHNVRQQHNTRIHALLREIRATPGSERFMLGSTYETLREAARNHPVVVLVAGRGHALALVMSSSAEGEPHVLRLDVTSDYVSGLRTAAEKAGLRSAAADTQIHGPDVRLGLREDKTKAMREPLQVLANLWRTVVKPVVDYLRLQKSTGRSRPRLHWCPNGDFTFLPLHAAGIYHGPLASQVCCSDYVVSSYAPTISALLRARARATSVPSSDVSMLLVGEDCARNPTLSGLWSVHKELASVGSIAARKGFGRSIETIAKDATVERVTEKFRSASFVHLACHGIQDETNALESGFHLNDGRLTISKLMELELDRPWFAYLSACETAKGDSNRPDQVMHLAAAMLFAGFKNVVATMWVMNDVDGPDLAEWFYEELMSSEIIDTNTVAYALDDAIQKLRAKTPSPKRWAQFIHMGA